MVREKKDLLELYNALNGSTYAAPDALEVVTLEEDPSDIEKIVSGQGKKR